MDPVSVSLGVAAATVTPTAAESPGVASQWELGTGLFWVVVIGLALYVLYWRIR